MKKVFTLMMFALFAVGANAQTWKASSTAPEAETALMDNELVTIKTVSETKTGGFKYTFDDIAFTNYIQVRTDGDANESAPTGGVQKENTALVVTAHKNVNVTFYFRRQKGSNGYDKDDNKDMLCYAQNGKSYESEESVFQSDDSYGYVKKTYSFVEDGIYTIHRNGSTLQVGGFVVSEPANDPAAAPTFNPAGGDIQAFSKITLTSDGTVYYQWQDAETTLTKDSEGWTAGSTVEVPNIAGTKYLYAYATNGEGLESEVVSATYNITEFTLTAVTEKTWTFTTADGWSAEDIATGEKVCRDNLILTGGDNFKLDGKVLALGGSGNETSRNVQFIVAPKSRITIKCASTGDASRTVKISSNGSVLGTIDTPTNKAAGTGYVNYTGADNATLFVYSGGSGINIYSIEVKPLPTSDTKEVTDAGWATYIPELDAQFKDGDAYIVTSVDKENGVVLIEGVTEVPANTPVLLKDEGNKEITFIDSANPVSNNLLKVYNAADAAGNDAYVLAKDEEEGAGFKKWTGTDAGLTGHAVLWQPSSAARGFFALDGEATGIKSVATSVEDGAIYDLQGRRVAQPKSGLYIVNGKKVVK